MTRLSINNPAAIVVALILIVVFGLISVRALPIQLLPDVERPAISIQTNWRSAAPEEVEESIIQPQEKVLRNIEGLESMVSEIYRGFGRIRLDFRVGWDMQRALIDTITQLNQAADLPADADEPNISSGGSSGRGQAASLLIYTLPGEAGLRAAWAGGVPALEDSHGASGKGGRNRLRLVNPPPGPLELELLTERAGAIPVAVLSWHELPSLLTAPFMGNWPDDAQPRQYGQRAEKVQRVDVPGAAR